MQHKYLKSMKLVSLILGKKKAMPLLPNNPMHLHGQQMNIAWQLEKTEKM